MRTKNKIRQCKRVTEERIAIVNCVICGNEMATTTLSKSNAKYCSKECRREAYHRRQKEKGIQIALNKDLPKVKKAKTTTLKDFDAEAVARYILDYDVLKISTIKGILIE